AGGRRARDRLDVDRVHADRGEIHVLTEREGDLLVDLPDCPVEERDVRQLEVVARAAASSSAACEGEPTWKREKEEAQGRTMAHGGEARERSGRDGGFTDWSTPARCRRARDSTESRCC